MSRELHVPLLLWVCAGLVVHLLGGSGVVGVTMVEEKQAEERAHIREMVWDVRRELGVIEMELDAAAAAEEMAEPEQTDPDDESLLSFTMRLLTAEDTPEEALPEEAGELDPWKAWIASMLLQ